ncbi:haloacid dehalogenase [Flavobacterium aquidurense]|uniref:cation-translocating P-type ATPase n=1 Tax=Flavobacterium aquidurense TaxID=362413 RepID=UPI0009188F00|nr:cation-translocating P-type ATPase [Flavobacterium aquidurense]OXA68263.1 haloacid dehalogenase [Flavobacterium aquidurense]SHH83248.1 Ca2+-transporting ATPase [Flavobacterium frigidimaris]
MSTNQQELKGLSFEEVIDLRRKLGINSYNYKKENRFLAFLKSIFAEPMVLLLLIASGIYFINKQYSDAIFLSVSILLIVAISLYQEKRSRNALAKLQEFTQPLCKVIRQGQQQNIKTQDIVVGDLVIIEEGSLVPADGSIMSSNDFSVNESILTGESMTVFKNKDKEDNKVFSGTTVVSGLAIVKIIAIGNETRLGKIGSSLDAIGEEKTPLELQIGNFIKKMVFAGALVFVLVWGINYSRVGNVLESLLMALTLAMSILPEEIPVAFTTFMALGARRLMKMGIVVKQMKTVETLGSATVICTDKTGTITQNKMELARLYLPSGPEVATDTFREFKETEELLTTAMWASEPIAFDPMEIALHDTYKKYTDKDIRILFKMIHEYPLSGKPPMMTHVFEDEFDHRIIAAKGAPEAIIEVCHLGVEEKETVTAAMNKLTEKGYRVLGVAMGNLQGNNYPEMQQEIPFTFKGLVAFYDPPKQNISEVLKSFYTAGIGVKIITGDNARTTNAIAQEIGFQGFDKSITGDQLMKLSDTELQTKVMHINVFSRMFPEAKLRIVNALKANGQIVAMTGDGVNDGPSLKAAHIGIAMGKKGTSIAKDAASLILVEDDLSKMVDAVAMGRKIYTNLKKAIQYIISIHIPIIFIVFLPLALGWIYPNIFSPLHVILLELIMGPTCSIIYENEPAEADTMQRGPRPLRSTFFNAKELVISIVQGIVITFGLLFVYQWSVQHQWEENRTRSMVFLTLITSNVLLTLVNRSFYYSLWVTLRYKNILVSIIIALTVFLVLSLFAIPFLRSLFSFELITFYQSILCILVGSISVLWFEVVKYFRRR